jgi:hypothetical protein
LQALDVNRRSAATRCGGGRAIQASQPVSMLMREHANP